jgi:uncharacterized protein (TIGR02001 family)
LAAVTLRPFACGAALSLALVLQTPLSFAADVWGGSLSVTSDYFVRGISRTQDRAALQLDLHYLNSSGFVAGLFASNADVDPDLPSDVELDAFVGFAWTAGSDWRGRILASQYAYPWNKLGSSYDYDELNLEMGYEDWLGVALTYSPNAPRYLPHSGLIDVSSEAAEVNLQHALLPHLSASGGIGYAYLSGPEAAGYGYWSIGAAYELAPVTLVLSYVNTTAAAKTLFYNAAADGRWTGTIIWRF